MVTGDDEVLVVQRLLARERLAIDDAEPGRTTFLSHLGAQAKLVPGPWLAHRDLVSALALANHWTPAQRSSLARTVLVEHGREFGVGQLQLEALASGLPFGGSSLLFAPRRHGPRCLYTWALGRTPTPTTCDWLLLRAEPEWALDPPRPILEARGLETLSALGGEVVVLLANAIAAVQVSKACGRELGLSAHPRFAPYLEGLDPEARVILWPFGAHGSAGLRHRELVAVVSIAAPEPVLRELRAWTAGLRSGVEPAVLVEAGCPDRLDRAGLLAFWQRCGRPKVLLSGDPAWAKSGAAWLRSNGATVHVQGDATQLVLL